MKTGIIGLGLIGGSLAKDLRRLYPGIELLGVDNNPAHMEEAIALNLVDEGTDYAGISDCDLIFLCIPVNAIIEEIPGLLDSVEEDTLVIDTGSTKAEVCEMLADHPKRRNFMASHPIAGTEFSGPSAAIEHLFNGKTNIICEVEKTAFKLQERALAVMADLGMRIRYMNPEAHDKHIAYVSHLSHISSFMLGKTVMTKEENERDIFDLASSGFESTVRLAKSSPDMWTPIFSMNKKHVLEALEEYIANLEHFKALLANDDGKAMYNQMQETNKIKAILDGIITTNSA